MEASAIRWLIQHVPAEFWLQFKELLDIINLTHREHMVVINKRLGYSTKKSFGKHLSYIGAVRVPTEVEVGSLPSSTLAWTDRNGQYYVDVMNQTYADVFQAAWPGVLLTLGMADKETIGDLVESLLGYYYNLRVVWDRTLQGPLADTCEDFIRALELACFARWAAGYAAPNTVG